MKKAIAILIMLVMVVSFAGCAASEKPNGNVAVDLPEDFMTWTDVDMVNYLKAEGVFTKDSLLYTQTEGIELPVGITKCISYMDDYYDADIMIMWFDPNPTTAKTEETYEEIKTTQTYVMVEAGDFPQPFNTMIGRFAFFYSWSLDTTLVDKMTAAIEKLEKEYGVKRDFFNLDIDEADYAEYDNTGDDVVIIDE